MVFPSKIAAVALTEAIITGMEMGKTRIESITPFALVVEDMVAKIVPVVAKPKVPKKIIRAKDQRTGSNFRL